MSFGKSAWINCETIILPPPGLTSNPIFDGQSEVTAIRNEMLAKYFGSAAKKINRLVTSLLDLPGLTRVWISILMTKLRRVFGQSSRRG